MKEFLDKKLQQRKQAGPPPSRALGVGVLGLHEGRTLLVALDRTASAFAVAGCDRDAQKIALSRCVRPDIFYTQSYADMLARPDVQIVAIYTPDALHGMNIVEAFEAGKDVICTKPLVNTVADARMVLEAGRRTGRRLLVGQSTRFFESFLRQRAAFEAGALGSLELADAHYIHRMDWFYEKSPWAVTDTDWVFLGMSHPVDLICWYLGEIDEVHAYGTTTALGKEYGVGGSDLYIVNLRSADGKIGRAMGHYGLRELPSARNCIELMLYGTRNSSLAQYHDMRYRHTNDDGTEVTEDPLYEMRHYYFNSEIHGMHYGEFANYTEHFARAIIEGRPHSPGLEEGIRTFCVMEAIRRSVKEQRPIRIQPLCTEVGLQ